MIKETAGETAILALPDNPIEAFHNAWPYLRQLPNGVSIWLQRQYTGECGALQTMQTLQHIVDDQAEDRRELKVITRVVNDENRHVNQIAELIRRRGEEPRRMPERELLAGMEIFDEVTWRAACARASLAESLRAGKARVLANDETLPDAIRKTFGSIIKDEAFHARAFMFLAGQEAIRMTAIQDANTWCENGKIELALAEAWMNACEGAPIV